MYHNGRYNTGPYLNIVPGGLRFNFLLKLLFHAIILTLPEADRHRGWSRRMVELIIRHAEGL
jgi:hypothetical protein